MPARSQRAKLTENIGNCILELHTRSLEWSTDIIFYIDKYALAKQMHKVQVSTNKYWWHNKQPNWAHNHLLCSSSHTGSDHNIYRWEEPGLSDRALPTCYCQLLAHWNPYHVLQHMHVCNQVTLIMRLNKDRQRPSLWGYKQPRVWASTFSLQWHD